MFKRLMCRTLAGAVLGVFAVAGAAVGQGTVAADRPTGWFGVTLSDEGVLDERGTTFFGNYPVVSDVEPNSPAARAGVMPGDILMSFNSHDMRDRLLDLRNWLKPGAPFMLRLKRNDEIRVVSGTLGRAPEGWEKRVVITVRPSEAFVLRTRTTTRPPIRSPQTVTTRIAVPTRVPPALIPNFTFGAGVYPFAGMEFTALNDDIRDVLGVKPEGVFVTNVVEGSPARVSGIRGGDVLVLANGVRLETPVDLVQVIAGAQEKTLQLKLVRKRKAQNLTLRW